nr:hypothetical protein HK105_006932 [Polyrhizophydium stewartii]
MLEAARDALAQQAGVFRFLKETLDSIAAEPDLAESSKHFQLAVMVAKLVAEVAKSEPARQAFADAQGIPLVMDLHRRSVQHLAAEQDEHYMDALTTQTMRALANLCFDHEGNRDIIVELPDAASSLVAPLSSRNTALLHTACGALVNISMDNETMQTALLNAGALVRLLDVLGKAGATPSSDERLEAAFPAAIRALSNLLEPELGIAQLLEHKGLTLLLRLVKTMHETATRHQISEDEYERAMEFLDGLAIVLETVGENDSVQREIVTGDLLDVLLDFVDHRPTHRPPPREDFGDDAYDYELIRRTVSRVVTSVTMNDDNMAELPRHEMIVRRFLVWMSSGLNTSTHKEEEEIRMSGALCIGNLARSDATCKMLVEKHNVGPALVSLIKLEAERLRAVSGARDEAKSSIKVLHAVIGALKNLSLAPTVRPVLGSLGIIERVVSLFEFEHLKPLHYGCIGVLKNLCAGENDGNVYRMMTGMAPGEFKTLADLQAPNSSPTSPLGRLITLIWRATGDNDTGIRNEGGRVLANIVRAINRTKAVQFLPLFFDLNCIAPLVQIVTGALLTKTAQSADDGGDMDMEDEHHVHFDALPSETQVFPLVQNEGLVSLTLICTLSPPATSKIVRYYSSLAPTLLTILRSGVPELQDDAQASASPSVLTKERGARTSIVGEQLTYSIQTKINVCLFLKTLLSNESEFVSKIAPELKPVVRTLLDVSHPPVDPSASGTGAELSASTGASHIMRRPDNIARTNTRSAKSLSDAMPSRRELQSHFQMSLEDITDPNVSFKEALKLVLGCLP